MHAHSRQVSIWLFCVASMVFAMVILGGLTRLTGSGLSMVDWRPITGWLPPFTTQEWLDTFQQYKQSPEYNEVNFGMGLEDFKNIFWLEYLHRLWGRFIGVAFAIPLIIFLWRGHIARSMILPLCLLFVLGGGQGVLGWYMVQSGLVDVPEVSQYRLAAHLGMAFLLYAALIWCALFFRQTKRPSSYSKSYIHSSRILWGLSFLTVLAGALVAGLEAGLTYNSFPFMDGELVPTGLYSLSPWYLNHFENITMVQFQHRWLGILTVAFLCWSFLQFRSPKKKATTILKWCLVIGLLQACLGIATLLFMVPLELAALHQTGGLVLFSLITWLNFEVRRSRE